MRLVATCASGTEGAVRKELARLGMRHAKGARGAVSFEGSIDDGMRACLWSRTAMRILAPLASFPAPDAAALYEGVRTVDWSEWLTVKTTLAVDATGTAPGLHHAGFVALKVKDGVVDDLRDRLGGRPDVDTHDPDVRIVVHLSRGQAELSLDLSGAPLYRRGYRTSIEEAPLKETLAASILALGGVDHDLPFLDPLCGSGTLAIEHAMAARRIAPGLRRAFGFQRWPRYRGEWQSAWDRLKEEARAAALPAAPAPIRASDISKDALEAARRNARAAGVDADVVIEQVEARTIQPFGEQRHDLHQPALRGADRRPAAAAGRLLPRARRGVPQVPRVERGRALRQPAARAERRAPARMDPLALERPTRGEAPAVPRPLRVPAPHLSRSRQRTLD